MNTPNLDLKYSLGKATHEKIYDFMQTPEEMDAVKHKVEPELEEEYEEVRVSLLVRACKTNNTLGDCCERPRGSQYCGVHSSHYSGTRRLLVLRFRGDITGKDLLGLILVLCTNI